MTEDSTTVARPRSELLGREAVFRVHVEGTTQWALVDPLAPARVLLGSSKACDIVVDDPLVSRRHLALSVEGERLHVTDLRTTNGTRVDGLSVGSCHLRGGETIEVGQTRLVVERVGDKLVEPLAPTPFGSVLGRSPAMRRLHPLLQRLAESDISVIIEGETGTGKEVLAEAIHDRSARRDRPFVVFDCTTVAATLVESALFGHVRGAFSGATDDRPGVFEQAEGGTLFIDEIGDLPLELQPKLLRAIQSRQVQRIGANAWKRVDVRIVAATRRDLEREVQAGRFREDLFYRLNVGRVELPPLRERQGDVGLLARHFWDLHGGSETPLPVDLFESWEDLPWTGNVRELENAVLRRLALGDMAPPHPPLSRSTSEEGLSLAVDHRVPLKLARDQAVRVFERRYVELLLAEHDGNASAAARAAGVSKRYINMLRARYDL